MPPFLAELSAPNPEGDRNLLAQQIQAEMAQLHATGAIDSEPGALEQLLNDLMDRRLSPEEVRAQLTALLGGRQDYH